MEENEGWICPKCSNVYAPFMMECFSCNKKQTSFYDLGGRPIKECKREVSQRFEEGVISDLMKLHDSNITKVAKIVKIDRKSVHRIVNRIKEGS